MIGHPPPHGHCRLAARYRQRLDQRAGGRLPQPVTYLIVEGLHLAGLDDALVVAQSVEELRTVGLGVDGLQLDVFDERSHFGTIGLRIHIDAALPGPDAGHGGERAEVGQRVHVRLGLGVDVPGKVGHVDAEVYRSAMQMAHSTCDPRDG